MSIFEWYWEKIIKPLDNARIKSLRVPTIYENNDIPYTCSGDRYHLLDVYSPVENPCVMPTIIDVHGGGWYYGDKELNKIYCLNLAERGFRVVNLSYRLTPNVCLKEQVADVATAINFVYDNAISLGVDLNNVFITGDSAGAHLAALIVNLACDPEMQKAFGLSVKMTFKAVCYTCAAFDISKHATKPITKNYFKPLLGKKAKGNPIFPYSSFRPEYSNLTPSIFITCDGDFMKKQTIAGYNQYISLGGECELVYFEKKAQTNRLMHVYNVTQPDWQESKEANDKTAAFFRKYID